MNMHGGGEVAAAVDSVAAAGWAELCDPGKAANIYVVPTGHALQ
jgi:hypothetical protein